METQGEIAMILDFDHRSSQAQFSAYTPLADLSYSEIQKSYLFACKVVGKNIDFCILRSCDSVTGHHGDPHG